MHLASLRGDQRSITLLFLVTSILVLINYDMKEMNVLPKIYILWALGHWRLFVLRLLSVETQKEKMIWISSIDALHTETAASCSLVYLFNKRFLRRIAAPFANEIENSVCLTRRRKKGRNACCRTRRGSRDILSSRIAQDLVRILVSSPKASLWWIDPPKNFLIFSGIKGFQRQRPLGRCNRDSLSTITPTTADAFMPRSKIVEKLKRLFVPSWSHENTMSAKTYLVRIRRLEQLTRRRHRSLLQVLPFLHLLLYDDRSSEWHGPCGLFFLSLSLSLLVSLGKYFFAN